MNVFGLQLPFFWPNLLNLDNSRREFDKTLISPTIKFRVEIECEVGGACHGVSSVQAR